MQYTLLQMVQRILSAMDSDDVNTINDTAESYQVALLIEGVYRDLVAECDFPENYSMFELNATSTSNPTVMTLPDNVLSLEWVKYDNKLSTDTYSNFVLVEYKDIDNFMEIINNYASINDATIIGTFDYSITNASNTDTVTFIYRKDSFPKYYTSFDDGTLIFDSLDTDEEAPDYLAKTKTQCYGSFTKTFTLSDEFVPELDAYQFSLLMNEAKARAFMELKQVANPNAEAHARRLRIRLRNTKRRVPNENDWPRSHLPNYGRK
jgi:RNAse (barnase) inhibitor barstar